MLQVNEVTPGEQDALNMYSGQKSILIMIIGKSGRGKSTAIRTLDPTTTHLINVLGKPLPFPKGFNYKEGQNLTTHSNADSVRRAMSTASRDPNIENLIIDDAQYIMATEFMDKALVKGYEKFTLMARNIWEVLILATKLRSGLKVFFLAHEEETPTERKMKTLGKLLDAKITPEGISTIVLYSDVVGNQDEKTYIFSTQSDGYTNAKSPFDLFPPQIPNDFLLISKRIDEYYSGVELKDSKLNFDISGGF